MKKILVSYIFDRAELYAAIGIYYRPVVWHQ